MLSVGSPRVTSDWRAAVNWMGYMRERVAFGQRLMIVPAPPLDKRVLISVRLSSLALNGYTGQESWTYEVRSRSSRGK